MSDEAVRSEPCPLCQDEGRDTAGDNLVTYEGHKDKYCVGGHGFVRGSQTANIDIKQNNDKKEKKVKKGFIDGVYLPLKKRGISRSTCEFYNYKVNQQKGVHIAEYLDEKGEVVMQQLRTPEKEFPLYGNKEKGKLMLWGAWKHTPNSNLFLTVTEGQIDALSVAEVFSCKYPVVSLPLGAGKAKDVLLSNMKYLLGFKYLVWAGDTDEVGRKALDDIIPLFPPGFLRIARWRLKDASDLLQEGAVEEIRKTIYNAVEYMPKPILTGDSLMGLLEGESFKSLEWPWPNANNILHNIKIPSILTIAAKPKTGKSEFVFEFVRYLLEKGKKVGLVVLEATPKETLIKAADSLNGTKLASVEEREFTEEEKKSVENVTDKISIYDHVKYGSKLEEIVKNIPYMVKGLGCTAIVFDNLSYAAADIGDDRKGIDVAMKALKDSTVQNNYLLLNVCHLKRTDGFQGLDEGCPVSVEGIRGSQSIEMFSDLIVGLHRDKDNEDPKIKNQLDAYILSDRTTGQDCGLKFSMVYDVKTKRVRALI